MKKKILYIITASSLVLFSCSEKLDLAPISSISDANYWQTPEQFDAFVSGVHIALRNNTTNLVYLGEMRADVFGTDPGTASTFTGEATQGVERLWTNTLTLDAPGVANYGNFYFSINQLNLLIEKTSTSTLITTANKNYYLGVAYGLRAYYYFQLTRAWGDVIIQTEPTKTIDIANLAKAASPAADVMKLVKEDIEKSLSAYGSDYSFKATKSWWSKAATQMLKAEVFLWTSHKGGGTADATLAKAALTDIQTSVTSLSLQASYANLFAYNNKGNSEIIFSIRNINNESALPFAATFFPQTGLIANFHDSAAARQFNSTTDNWGGLLRAPIKIASFRKFNDLDTRKRVSIQAAYNKSGTNYTMAGCFVNKYQGEQVAGNRSYTNDFPIYRYADLLLLLAEAKILLGESPAAEINLVRARAFGTNYNAAVHGFPNQAIDAVPKDALLQERFLEFIFEGKRWHDLRRFGDSYVFANTNILPAEAYKVLWPIDRNTLTNNRALEQTPGYPKF
jgi:starch-binding outer membrane protein, SusD/RagB family